MRDYVITHSAKEGIYIQSSDDSVSIQSGAAQHGKPYHLVYMVQRYADGAQPGAHGHFTTFSTTCGRASLGVPRLETKATHTQPTAHEPKDIGCPTPQRRQRLTPNSKATHK